MVDSPFQASHRLGSPTLEVRVSESRPSMGVGMHQPCFLLKCLREHPEQGGRSHKPGDMPGDIHAWYVGTVRVEVRKQELAVALLTRFH